MRILLILLLLSGSAYADDVILYDTDTKAVTEYIESINSDAYRTCNDCLIVPATEPQKVDEVRVLFKTIPRKYLEYHDPLIAAPRIRQMNQSRRDAVDAAEQAVRDQLKATREAPINAIQTVDDVKNYLKTLTANL